MRQVGTRGAKIGSFSVRFDRTCRKPSVLWQVDFQAVVSLEHHVLSRPEGFSGSVFAEIGVRKPSLDQFGARLH